MAMFSRGSLSLKMSWFSKRISPITAPRSSSWVGVGNGGGGDAVGATSCATALTQQTSSANARNAEATLRNQDRGARRAPRFQVAVGRRDVAQRIALSDVYAYRLALDHAEQLARRFLQGRACRGVVKERRTGQEQRAAATELQRHDRGHGSRGIAERDHHVERAQRVERRKEGVLADRVVHHVYALALRQRLDARTEILVSDQHVMAAVLFG